MGLSLGTLFPLSWRLWLGKRLFRELGPTTTRVSWHRVIKGPVGPEEVEAMQYVASHTDIPIPKVYGIHIWRSRIFIEMAFVQGEDLEQAWLRGRVSERDKKAIVADVARYISVLRELPPPQEDLVSSALQNPAYDCRIGARWFGPFTQDDFHTLTRDGHWIKEDAARFFGPVVHKVHNTRYRTHFTHGDIAPRNIMFKNGRVSAIIDWAFSGWYPEYWEFTKISYNYLNDDWDEHMRSVLQCYDTELAAEEHLQRLLEKPGTKSSSYRDGVCYKRAGSSPSESWTKAREGRQMTDLWSIAMVDSPLLR